MFKRGFDRGPQLIVEDLLLGNLRQDLRMTSLEEAVQLFLVAPHVFDIDRIQITLCCGKDDDDLFFDRERLVLRLFQNLHQPPAAIQLCLCRFVEVASKLRERRKLAVLCEIEAQRAGHLPHRSNLRGPAYSRDGVADVDRRAHALMEQVGLEEDLAVGNRDDVRGNVGRQVAGLRFNDRQRCQRASAMLSIELGGSFEQARVQIEDVTWIRFAPRRPAQEQGNFTIRLRMFG